MSRKGPAAAALFLVLLSGCARAPRASVLAPFPAVGAPMPVSGGLYHTVSRGETIYRIGKIYAVDPKELMRVNGVHDPSHLEIGQRLFIPSVGLTSPSIAPSFARGLTIEGARHLVGLASKPAVWRTITVHHSATRQGSAKAFDRDHRRRHMGGLFYHFVIGNGTGTSDGAVEVGWRWRQQVKSNRLYDINVCLVGDFSLQQVSQAQIESLVNLIHALRARYSISLESVRKHEDVKGRHTACPGKNFPFQRLMERLAATGVS